MSWDSTITCDCPKKWGSLGCPWPSAGPVPLRKVTEMSPCPGMCWFSWEGSTFWVKAKFPLPTDAWFYSQETLCTKLQADVNKRISFWMWICLLKVQGGVSWSPLAQYTSVWGSQPFCVAFGTSRLWDLSPLDRSALVVKHALYFQSCSKCALLGQCDFCV